MNAEALKTLVQNYSLASARYASGAGLSDEARLRVTATCMAAFAAIDALCAENAELQAKLASENAALVFRCASVAQEEAHKWEGSALQASEAEYDVESERTVGAQSC